MMPPIPTRPAARENRDYYHDYEFSDLDEITMRQLNEDILAYRYDLDYCKAQLEEADLTPQETRTLQLRTLDLGHQIRHCTHRIETIKAQARKHSFRPSHGTIPTAPYPGNGSNGNGRQARTMGGGYGGGLPAARQAVTATPTLSTGKRPMLEEDGGGAKRMKMATPDFDIGGGLDEGVNTSLQRLGFWKCRLCSAPKYLLAGAGRSPAAPCKWPLKDISKMITHFTEMHGEHTPAERCVELGCALAQNRMFSPSPSLLLRPLPADTGYQVAHSSIGFGEPAPRTSATPGSLTTASRRCSTARCPTSFGAIAGLLLECPSPEPFNIRLAFAPGCEPCFLYIKGFSCFVWAIAFSHSFFLWMAFGLVSAPG
jgi:hypothetical protein